MNDSLKRITQLIALLQDAQTVEAIALLNQWKQQLEHSSESVSPRVLVLDDNAEFLELLDEYFRALGFQAILCSSLHEARRQLALNHERQHEISYALLDIMLGTEHGHRLIPDLLNFFPSIKIIFISGHAPEQQLMTMGMSSVIGVLQKPFGLTALKTLLSEA